MAPEPQDCTDDPDSVSLQDIGPPVSHTGFSGQHLPFVGFTFTTNSCFSDRCSISKAAQGVLQKEGEGQGRDVESFERRIRCLEQEKQDLNRRLQGGSDFCIIPVQNGLWL